jgi:hypothetical protein
MMARRGDSKGNIGKFQKRPELMERGQYPPVGPLCTSVKAVWPCLIWAKNPPISHAGYTFEVLLIASTIATAKFLR